MAFLRTSRVYRAWRTVGWLLILAAGTPLGQIFLGEEPRRGRAPSVAGPLLAAAILGGAGIAILAGILSVAAIQRRQTFNALSRRWALKLEDTRAIHREAIDLIWGGESAMRHFDIGWLLSGKLNGVKIHAFDMRWGGYLADKERITMDFRRLLEASFEDDELREPCSAVVAWPLSKKARVRCVERLGKIHGAAITLPGTGIVMIAKRRVLEEKEFNEAIDALMEAAEAEAPLPELMPIPGEFPGNY